MRQQQQLSSPETEKLFESSHDAAKADPHLRHCRKKAGLFVLQVSQDVKTAPALIHKLKWAHVFVFSTFLVNTVAHIGGLGQPEGTWHLQARHDVGLV